MSVQTKRVDQEKLHGLDIDETQMTQQVSAEGERDSGERANGRWAGEQRTSQTRMKRGSESVVGHAELSLSSARPPSSLLRLACCVCVCLQDVEFVAFTQRAAILNIFGGATIGFGVPFLASTTTRAAAQRSTEQRRIAPPVAKASACAAGAPDASLLGDAPTQCSRCRRDCTRMLTRAVALLSCAAPSPQPRRLASAPQRHGRNGHGAGIDGRNGAHHAGDHQARRHAQQ